jgi:CubicO group peptidase (beta-lactamase class C family)
MASPIKNRGVHMIRSAVFFLCVLSMFLFPVREAKAFWGSEKCSPKAERAKKVLDGVDELIQNSMRDYMIPGAAIGVVVDGTVVYVKGYGLRDLEKKIPVTTDTLFPVGSFTKAFTSFAVGCLIDEGLIGWDDRIVDWLPDFRLSDQYVSQILTLRDLLSHQTQLPRHDYVWYNSDLSRDDLFRRLRRLDLITDGYDRFHYNNLMYMVVGMVMEKAAHKPWEEIVSQKILNPLRMTHSGFSVSEMQKSSDYAFPYIEKDGKLKRMKFRDYSLIAPAGGMFSNVNDLCRWMQLNLKQGEWQQKSLISVATFKEMQSPQVVVGGYPESKEEQVRAYGLGWYVQSYLGVLNVMHDGVADGFISIISMLPQKNIGVVVLCNKNFNAWPRLVVMELFDRLLEMPQNDWLKEGLTGMAKNKEISLENQKKESLNRKKDTHPSHPLEEYAGEYEHPGYGRIVVECVDGALQVVFNHLTYRLEHWHYDVFNVCEESDDTFFSFKNTKFTFRNNLNGDVSELIVPLEMKSPDIIFSHKQADSLSNTAYLRSFSGIYEIYSYTVEIMLRNQTLYAVIPGQPMFELIPSGKNEFTIKSYAGFSVRFVMDANNQVEEVLLIQPYGIVYTAKPKQNPS